MSAAPSLGSLPYTIDLYNDSSKASTTEFTRRDLPGGDGVYFVKAVDGVGCTRTAYLTVANPPELFLNATAVDVSCAGSDDGAVHVVAFGGTPPYLFRVLGSPNNNWQTGPSLFVGAPGLYTVQVQDKNGCTTGSAVQVDEPEPLTVETHATNAPCHGVNGSIVINVNGGTLPITYLVSDQAVKLRNDSSVSISAGTWFVNVQDNRGCQLTTPVTLTVSQPPALLAFANATAPTCPTFTDGSVSVNASGGVAPYLYSLGGNAEYHNNSELTGVKRGDYNVTVRDANQCELIVPVSVAGPAAINFTVTIGADITCFGGTNGEVSILATGGVAPYNYSLNGAAAQESNVFEDLAGDRDYNLTIHDSTGCPSYTNIIRLPQPTAVGANVTITLPTCVGREDGQVVVSGFGGVAPYTYAFSRGGPFDTINTFASGAAVVEVEVQDANMCVYTIPASQTTVTDPQAITATVRLVDNRCSPNDVAQFVVSVNNGKGPFTYTMNNGAPQASNSFSVSGEGVFNFTVTDANECHSATIESTLPAGPAALEITTPTITPVTCYGNADGSVSATGSGGVGTYQWSLSAIHNGSRPTGSFNSLPGGSYYLFVSDDHHCSANKSFVVPQAASMIML